MAQGREENCRKLLATTKKIADDIQTIEDCKEAARIDAQEHKEGYTVKVDGLGEVEVSAPAERKLKGLAHVLDQETYLDLSESRRKKLIADGLVIEEREYQPARKPSVTVRL